MILVFVVVLGMTGLGSAWVRADQEVGSTLADGATVGGSVHWQVFPPDETSTHVTFTIDGGSAWTDDAAPFEYGRDDGTWDTTRYSNGIHRLMTRVFSEGNEMVLSTIRVRVDNPTPDGCPGVSPLPCADPVPSDEPSVASPEDDASQFARSTFRIPNPTSMAWGPDDRLYVAEMFGRIHALSLDHAHVVVKDEIITTLEPGLTLGLTIDPESSAQDVILWVSHSSPLIDDGVLNSGVVSRLAGPRFTERTDVITGLPRSLGNHAVNSLHFGPDGRLYIAQGGNTTAGAPNLSSSDFGDRPEQPLSAAILVADVKAAGFGGRCGSQRGVVEIPETCDVRTFATGLRNSYDFVLHSNGQMYATVNGVGLPGTFPPRPTPPCTGFGDLALMTAGGHDPGAQTDYLLRVQEGRYYGHPNPYRDECVFGNGSLQGVPALPNFMAPIYDLGFHKSSNGIIEYLGDAMGGDLKGDLLIANYSAGDDITRLRLSPNGTSVIASSTLVGGFADPLPLAQSPDGTIFVGEFGAGRVTVLVPMDR